MTESSPVRNPETSPTRDLLNAVRDYLHGWRGIAILAGVAMIAGLAFNWSWLVAAGIAGAAVPAALCRHVRAGPLHEPHGRAFLLDGHVRAADITKHRGRRYADPAA